MRLRHEATHDTLTGLPNRRAFRRRLVREMETGNGLAVVLCDMDNLKTVNDTHGHEAGDKALQKLAGALSSQLRRSDEAYRIGGDEFAVILPGAARLDAERVMCRLRDAVGAGALRRRRPDRGQLRHIRLPAGRRPGAAGRARRRGALRDEAAARAGRLDASDAYANMRSCPTSSSTATPPSRSWTGPRIRSSWPAAAAEQGHEALALTDHDGLHGAMEMAQALKPLGVRPITGAELTLDDGSHLTLLCETREGYTQPLPR